MSAEGERRADPAEVLFLALPALNKQHDYEAVEPQLQRAVDALRREGLLGAGLEAENARLRELYENAVGNRERFGWTINHLLECEEALRVAQEQSAAGLTPKEEMLTAEIRRFQAPARPRWGVKLPFLPGELEGYGSTLREALEAVAEGVVAADEEIARERLRSLSGRQGSEASEHGQEGP